MVRLTGMVYRPGMGCLLGRGRFPGRSRLAGMGCLRGCETSRELPWLAGSLQAHTTDRAPAKAMHIRISLCQIMLTPSRERFMVTVRLRCRKVDWPSARKTEVRVGASVSEPGAHRA
jgi:hypothetical protein